MKRYGPPPEGTTLPEDPFRRLVRVAVHADRRTVGGLAGHQAAIRRLFPATPVEAVCAFCITEDRGPHPKYIYTALVEQPDGTFRLNGSKRWGSVSPDSDLLYVAASIGRDGETNHLRMVALPADRAGVSLDLEPYLDYGTEHRLADIFFDNVVVQRDEIVSGDAYVEYIKLFRLVEDVYNTAGAQIALFRMGREHGFSRERLEDLLGLICQAGTVATTDMVGPEAILLLSAYLRASNEFWVDTWANWTDAPADIRKRWQPDRGLLEVAARAREIRRETAWTTLGSTPS